MASACGAATSLVMFLVSDPFGVLRLDFDYLLKRLDANELLPGADCIVEGLLRIFGHLGGKSLKTLTSRIETAVWFYAVIKANPMRCRSNRPLERHRLEAPPYLESSLPPLERGHRGF